MKPFLSTCLPAVAVAAFLMIRPDAGKDPAAGASRVGNAARPALPEVHGAPAPAAPAASEATVSSALTGPLPAGADEVSLAGWRERLARLRAGAADATEAYEQLAAEMDHGYCAWLQGEIRVLAAAPPRDRLDRLAELETLVVEGGAAIVGHLAIPGAPAAMVLADTLEVLCAEIQYAEMAPTPEARLALWRLDQQRQTRLAAAVAGGAGPESFAEVDAWYDQQMAAIVAMIPGEAVPATGGGESVGH